MTGPRAILTLDDHEATAVWSLVTAVEAGIAAAEHNPPPNPVHRAAIEQAAVMLRRDIAVIRKALRRLVN